MGIEPKLTHVDEHGQAHMVDISHKSVSVRIAKAQAVFRTRSEVIAAIYEQHLPKGDVLAVARVAAIMAAKKTSEVIPLCHPLALTGITVDFILEDESILITAQVKTTEKTGVEMEALTAVSIAALTVYDMVKAVDP